MNLIFLILLSGIFLFIVFKIFSSKSLRAVVWKNREAKFLFLGYIIIPSILFTISGIPIRDHYMIVLFPMIQILFTLLVHAYRPKLISWILVCQFWISANFLIFVHQNLTIQGDYGVPFSVQAKLQNPIPEKVPEQAP